MTIKATVWIDGWYCRRARGVLTATLSRLAASVWAATLVAFLFMVVPGWVPKVAWAQSVLDQQATAPGLRPVFSPDGTKLASAAADGLITVLNLKLGRELATLGDAQGSVSALAFSPDGRVVAGAKGDTIILWGLQGRVESLALQVDAGRLVNRLAFSPQGDRLAAVVDGVDITIWELATGANGLVLSSTGETITDIAFSADGSLLASVGPGAEVGVWDLKSGQQRSTLSSATAAPMTSVVFSPVGHTLAGADEDGNISLWDLDTGRERVLAGHADLIKRLRFSPSGSSLASDGMDAQLLVHDMAPGQAEVMLPGRLDTLVTGLAFSPDGRLLASVGPDDEIVIWDLASGALVQALGGQSAPVLELAFGSAGRTLASVATDGQVIVWNLPAGTQRFSTRIPVSAEVDQEVSSATTADGSLTGGPSASTAAAASATDEVAPQAVTTATSEPTSRAITSLAAPTIGTVFASAGADGSVRLWSDTGASLLALEGHPGAVASSVVFGSDNKELISSGRDTEVRSWDRATGTLTQVLLANEHPIRAVARSGDGNYLASAGEETRVMLWDAKKGRLERILNQHKGFVNTLAFSPNGLRLASGGQDGLILRWDVKDGALVDGLLGHAGPVNALAYSIDGLILASGSSDTTVKLWDTKTGQQTKSLGHPWPVKSVAISTNKKDLASAGQGTSIYIWDIQKNGGTLVKILNNGTSLINALAYLPNGKLVAGHEDGSITIWDVDNAQVLQIIMPSALPLTGGLPAGSDPLDPQPEAPAAFASSADAGSANAESGHGLLNRLAARLLDWLIPSAAAEPLADPNQGPGGPILIIKSASSPFGNYYAEILRAEGFNAFAVADLGSVTSEMLATYDLVILAETPPLLPEQVNLLSDWVNAGGDLIAMRPDPQLASLVGVTATGSTLSEGYLRVDTSAAPGNGIVGETMQFHGTATRFDLDGATAVATLYSDAATATANPAVTLRSVGTSGGQAAAFAYDLATSIVYTRQGNPAWANQERDGFAPQRSDDKYYGAAATDPQADWVDLNKAAIPQADEQQRLLANLIIQMTLDKKPLPRFWYFPRGEKAVFLMTGDDHGNNGTEGRWNDFLAVSPAGCSLENWECVRGTSYMYPNTPMSDAQAAAFEAQGFEVGLHLNTNCADYTQAELESFYTQQISGFISSWPSVPLPTTQRHHCIAWTDWVTAAKVQSSFGVRLDTSYYFWPPSWVENRPGFFNGSGMPMRFADLDGTLINVYQAATQMTDESGQQYPYTIDTLLDRALGAEGYYGVYVINAHTDLAVIPESTASVASALARGVPIITSRQLLQWLDGRDNSSFGSIAWDGATLSFTVTAGDGANGLEALVPMYSSTGVVSSVRRDGAETPYTLVSRKGVEYASFSATTGVYEVTYGVDTVAPTVVAFTPGDGETDVSRANAVAATFSEPMDAATITAAKFQLIDPLGATVNASVSYDAETRTATLTPSSALAAESAYTAILYSGATDLFANPIVSDLSWTFTTEASSNCPCTVWTSSGLPAIASAADPNALELGVKFRADIDGFITGIRFYKGSLNTGTHIGNLWTSEGTLLASATFTNETATGWQQVDFATPVPISANTVYVASYHAPNGGYAISSSFFAVSGVDNPPLHQLSDSEANGNGVYRYGPSGFPSQSWNASNYWVDVVFDETGVIPGDTTPPTVTSTGPVDGATEVSTSAVVSVVFSEAMDAASIASATFELRDGSGALVAASVSYEAASQTAT
ncbi:MAG: DUF4082 domain-containing protein, partial [Chromatiaceae bacterium]